MAGYDGMTPQFATALQALIAASGGRVRITSGYRSPEHQAQLFAAAVKKYGSEAAARKYVAPPGHSNHNKGLAADLAGDLAWAHANAKRFGLTFPMSWENWHIELVGARGAKQGHTDQPDTPAAMNAVDDPTINPLKDPKVQLANLLAIVATTPQPTETF